MEEELERLPGSAGDPRPQSVLSGGGGRHHSLGELRKGLQEAADLEGNGIAGRRNSPSRGVEA